MSGIDKLTKSTQAISGSIAAFSAAAILSMTTLSEYSDLQSWALQCFIISLPLAISAFYVLIFPFNLGGSYWNWLLLCCLTGASTIFLCCGVVLLVWNVSYVHGLTLLIASVLGYSVYLTYFFRSISHIIDCLLEKTAPEQSR